jgi:hypothetical protein
MARTRLLAGVIGLGILAGGACGGNEPLPEPVRRDAPAPAARPAPPSDAEAAPRPSDPARPAGPSQPSSNLLA